MNINLEHPLSIILKAKKEKATLISSSKNANSHKNSSPKVCDSFIRMLPKIIVFILYLIIIICQ